MKSASFYISCILEHLKIIIGITKYLASSEAVGSGVIPPLGSIDLLNNQMFMTVCSIIIIIIQRYLDKAFTITTLNLFIDLLTKSIEDTNKT